MRFIWKLLLVAILVFSVVFVIMLWIQSLLNSWRYSSPLMVMLIGMVDVEPKVLSCLFWDDVLCSYRRTEKFGVMDKCMKCSHYLRFLRVMHELDMKDDEIERMRRYEPYG